MRAATVAANHRPQQQPPQAAPERQRNHRRHPKRRHPGHRKWRAGHQLAEIQQGQHALMEDQSGKESSDKCAKPDHRPTPRNLATDATVSELRARSEEHTSELQSLMRISYAVFCLKKKTNTKPLR